MATELQKNEIEQIQLQISKKILVFFRLALMNPRTAEEASQTAYDSLRKFAKVDPKALEIIFVRTTFDLYQKARAAAAKARRVGDHPFELSGIDLSPWRDFIRHAPEEEILSMIWVQILNLSTRSVGRGLGVSEGTIRHRVSRAIRKLSTKVEGGDVRATAPKAEAKKAGAKRSWK